MIITRFSQLTQEYHRLAAGDVFVGQLLNASKVAQAFVLNPWMVPHTFAITRRRELLEAITAYDEMGISTAVTKADGLHCGHGVRKWDNLETLYSCLAFDDRAYPFVLQPHVADFTDIRVVIVGDYTEAYCRSNPHNFRKNLAVGGRSTSHVLAPAEEIYCRMISVSCPASRFLGSP